MKNIEAMTRADALRAFSTQDETACDAWCFSENLVVGVGDKWLDLEELRSMASEGLVTFRLERVPSRTIRHVSLTDAGRSALDHKAPRPMTLDTQDLSTFDHISQEPDGTWVSFRSEGHEALLIVVNDGVVAPMATSAITTGRLLGVLEAFARAKAFVERNGLKDKVRA